MNTEDVVGAAKIGKTTKTGETIATADGDRPHGPQFSAVPVGPMNSARNCVML